MEQENDENFPFFPFFSFFFFPFYFLFCLELFFVNFYKIVILSKLLEVHSMNILYFGIFFIGVHKYSFIIHYIWSNKKTISFFLIHCLFIINFCISKIISFFYYSDSIIFFSTNSASRIRRKCASKAAIPFSLFPSTTASTMPRWAFIKSSAP